jgi:hypothetical protein
VVLLALKAGFSTLKAAVIAWPAALVADWKNSASETDLTGVVSGFAIAWDEGAEALLLASGGVETGIAGAAIGTGERRAKSVAGDSAVRAPTMPAGDSARDGSELLCAADCNVFS